MKRSECIWMVELVARYGKYGWGRHEIRDALRCAGVGRVMAWRDARCCDWCYPRGEAIEVMDAVVM